MTVLGIGERQVQPVFGRPPPAKRIPLIPHRRGHSNISTAMVLLPLLIGALIEMALVFRLWAQVTSQDMKAGLYAFVFDVSSVLVAPFQTFEPATPIKQTGILEIATLVAMQGYFVAAVGAFALLLAMRSAAVAVSRHLEAGRTVDTWPPRPIIEQQS